MYINPKSTYANSMNLGVHLSLSHYTQLLQVPGREHGNIGIKSTNDVRNIFELMLVMSKPDRYELASLSLSGLTLVYPVVKISYAPKKYLNCKIKLGSHQNFRPTSLAPGTTGGLLENRDNTL